MCWKVAIERCQSIQLILTYIRHIIVHMYSNAIHVSLTYTTGDKDNGIAVDSRPQIEKYHQPKIDSYVMRSINPFDQLHFLKRLSMLDIRITTSKTPILVIVAIDYVQRALSKVYVGFLYGLVITCRTGCLSVE